jgi:hypothetical protein
LPNLIHPLAKIDTYFGSNWDEIAGNIICATVVLSCEVKLGHNNLINVGCILSHDTLLGNHNTLMQGYIVNGFVKLKDEWMLSPSVVLTGEREFNDVAIKSSLDNY